MADISNTSDFYDRLGVPRGATHDEVRSAYRRLAREYHPDFNSEVDATVKFQYINEAYQVLGNEEKRSKYDATSFTAPPVEGTTTQTDEPGVHKETKTKVDEPSSTGEKSGRVGNKAWETYADFFAGYEAADSTNQTMPGYGETQRNKKSKTEGGVGILAASQKLEIDKAELDLMAGYVEALNTKGPFEAECGDYRLIKEADSDGSKGNIRIEVRLGRFNKTLDGDIKIRNGEGWGYRLATGNDFVSVDDLNTPFKVMGINKPLGYEGYLNKITDMAEGVASGRPIGANEIMSLDVAGRMGFHKREGRVEVTGGNLKDELSKRLDGWKIRAPEGTVFNNREGAKVSNEKTRI